MKATLIGLLLTTSTATAVADGMLYSSEQQDYAVTYTEANGKESDATLSKGTDTLGYLAIPAKPGKGTPVVIKDPDGTVLAKTTVVDNRSYVIVGTGKSVKLVTAGLVANTASSSYAGTSIVSALAGKFTIDLFGDSGAGSAKGVKPVAAFDIKTATKLPTSDNRYKATIHLPDGTKVQGLSSVDAGFYYVLHKNYEGKVTLSSAGHIEQPGKK